MQTRPALKWRQSSVDRTREYFELRHGSTDEGGWADWLPVALVGQESGGEFIVEFLVGVGDPSKAAAIGDVRRELDFYLVEKGEADPWAYARYHCDTAANLYSKVHWSFLKSHSDRLAQFEGMLVARLGGDELPRNLVNEGDLEKRFVLPLVRECADQVPGLRAYAHPWRQSTTCEPNCTDGRGIVTSPELHGCPDCWNRSKDWAAVRLYGLHCFDVVIGNQGDSLAVELKLLRRTGRGNRRANNEVQRLLGQCMIARLVHSRVVGFCVAEEGAIDLSKAGQASALRDYGVTLVVRTVDRTG